MEETQQTTSTEARVEESPPPAPPHGRRIGRTIAVVLLVAAFVVAIGALLYGLATHPILTSVLRDISIIVLALVTMVTGIFLAILVFQLQSLIVLLRDEIYPILDSVNRTASTVRGTTTFVSDRVVSPVISAASYVSAIRQALRLLFGSPSRSQKPHQGRTQKPTEPPDL